MSNRSRTEIVNVLSVGTEALSVELDTLEGVLGLCGWLSREPAPGQVDLIPASKSLLIKLLSSAYLSSARSHLHAFPGSVDTVSNPRIHEVDVVYDGADIEALAKTLGTTVPTLVQFHTAQNWKVAFGGFVPGFFYLVTENNPFTVARKSNPRTNVPVGAVALADAFTGIYPRNSPGGWQLIGRTDAVLWDSKRIPPAFFRQGDEVRFRAVKPVVPIGEEAPAPSSAVEENAQPNWHAAKPSLTVLTPGLMSSLQDLGRHGNGGVGVPSSGAADRGSHDLANRLVGNDPDAATIESTLGGLRLQAECDLVVAVTGARARVFTISDIGCTRPRPLNTAFCLRAGEKIMLDAPEVGLRNYLAVRGGIDAPLVLGSRSRDFLSNLGPAPLVAGNSFDVGNAAKRPVEAGALPDATELGPQASLRITLGPHKEWFNHQSVSRLLGQRWSVKSSSNRVGLRITAAEPLIFKRLDEFPTEGMVAGALQVPPAGQPVVFLRDHPVTGGYPVIAVVIPADLDRAAQLPPGGTIRFTLNEKDTHA